MKNNYKKSFLKTGVVNTGVIFNKKDCKKLYDEILNTRDFANSLFVSEKYFNFKEKLNNFLLKLFPRIYPGLINLKKKIRKRSKHPEVGVKGPNLAKKIDLTVIEENLKFKKILTDVCGKNYKILLKKVVVGAPKEWIPFWVEKNIKNSQDTNLAKFVKQKYRDVTYFRGIDFHQDIKDEAKKNIKDFITAYIYLNDVNTGMAPLITLKNSHKFGVTKFPHKLKVLVSNKIKYSNDYGKSLNLQAEMLLGKSGQFMFWTSYTLHGTRPQFSSTPRISLRYFIQMKTPHEKCLLNNVQKKINGSLLGETRNDLDPLRRIIKRGNIINNLFLKKKND